MVEPDRDSDWQPIEETRPIVVRVPNERLRRLTIATACFFASLVTIWAMLTFYMPAPKDDLAKSEDADQAEKRDGTTLVVTVEPATAKLINSSKGIFISGGNGTWQVEIADLGVLPTTLEAKLNGYAPARLELDVEKLPAFTHLVLRPIDKPASEGHSFEGHTQAIRSVRISPNGKWFVTASDDGTVRLWDLKSRREVCVLQGHSGSVLCADFSPDSTVVASGGSDSQCILWDVETGKQLRVLDKHPGWVESVTFSPNGERLLTTTGIVGTDEGENTAILWDSATGAKIRTFSGHANAVCAARFSPDASQIVTGSADSTVRLWNCETGEQIRVFVGHAGVVTDIGFSADGKRIASASLDKTLRLWATATGQLLREFRGHEKGVSSLQWVGDCLVSVSTDATVRLWDSYSGQQVALRKLQSPLKSVGVTPDGTQVIAVGASNAARLLVLNELTDAREIAPQPIEIFQETKRFNTSSRIIWDIALSADLKRIAIAGDDRIISIWNIDQNFPYRVLGPHETSVSSVCWSGDGVHMFSCCRDGSLREWSLASGQIIKSWQGTSTPLHAVRVSQDGSRLYTVGESGTLLCWEQDGSSTMFYEDTKPLRCLETVPTQNLLLFGGNSGVVYASQDRPASVTGLFMGNQTSITSLFVSADGKLAATASGDSTARLWNVDSGSELGSWLVDGEILRVACLSPDNLWFAAGSESGTVYIWHVDSKTLRFRLFGHRAYLTDMLFASPDRLITASRDGTCRLWQLED